jgi:hypothetical protein
MLISQEKSETMTFLVQDTVRCKIIIIILLLLLSLLLLLTKDGNYEAEMFTKIKEI